MLLAALGKSYPVQFLRDGLEASANLETGTLSFLREVTTSQAFTVAVGNGSMGSG